MDERTCIECGEAISQPKRRDAVYCSKKCQVRRHHRVMRLEQRLERDANGRVCMAPECSSSLSGRRSTVKYCTPQCRDRTNRELAINRRPTRWCMACDSVLPQARRGGRLYCSPGCQSIFNTLKKYGLDGREYRTLLASQGHQCAICGVDESALWSNREVTRDGWHIDHDHATGKVRGILCPHCNLMLGHAKDDPSILAAAIEYLSQ